jgi:hypothetical protein
VRGAPSGASVQFRAATRRSSPAARGGAVPRASADARPARCGRDGESARGSTRGCAATRRGGGPSHGARRSARRRSTAQPRPRAPVRGVLARDGVRRCERRGRTAPSPYLEIFFQNNNNSRLALGSRPAAGAEPQGVPGHSPSCPGHGSMLRSAARRADPLTRRNRQRLYGRTALSHAGR